VLESGREVQTARALYVIGVGAQTPIRFREHGPGFPLLTTKSCTSNRSFTSCSGFCVVTATFVIERARRYDLERRPTKTEILAVFMVRNGAIGEAQMVTG